MSSATGLATLLMLWGVGSANGEKLPPCTRFESRLLVTPKVLQKGAAPQFVLELANVGTGSLRLLDVRNGRRPDLADTYYRVVVRSTKGATVFGPRQISDPGPISDSDFFVLEPGAKASLNVRSLVDLAPLAPGGYVAFVSVWQDPYSASSACRTADAEFRVQ